MLNDNHNIFCTGNILGSVLYVLDGDKCSETYRGPQPFSEVEMRNIRDYVLKLDPVPILSTCVHSYGQLYLWPYGYDYEKYPSNYKEIVSLTFDLKIQSK